ncbi:FHA domain-containing protein [Dyella subtropica]|uniref:FHA domain-containing protein n=1 Tax=Dyella subtropica TaxID=2992127 RepID=UPI00224E3BBA|nr:FHA domain-containing protein [Dyella subtropica]
MFSAEELRQFASEAEAGSDGRASAHEPVLEGVSAGLESRRYSLRSGRQTIGRRNDSDIVVDDLSVSASHAWIINQHGHYVIMNTLSTNGTFVNDKRVHEAVLKHGDRIRLGQAEFVFRTRERGTPPPSLLRYLTAGLLMLIALGVLIWQVAR